MSKPLPKSNFKWMRAMPTEEEILNKKENGKIGWILEVDLEYPQELHEEHDSFPLALEKKNSKKEWMSPYQRRLIKDLDLNPPGSEKLLLTLQNKNNYVVHYRNLQFYLNKPVYTGMTILDNSKILMYDFFYNHLKKQYGPKCELLYTDTDNLLLEIETDDVYKDMEANKHLYDTSDYPKEHPLYSNTNKKVLGKMKDKCAGTPIAECVCLRPKMYSILKADEKNIKKAKGVKKSVVKKQIMHEQ